MLVRKSTDFIKVAIKPQQKQKKRWVKKINRIINKSNETENEYL